MTRVRLGVNIDHVATLRQARGTRYPDPVLAAATAELAGADQITVHLREDRRHIQDRDLRVLKETVQTHLNLEMAATDEMVAIALGLHPGRVTLVPERREELTTEGGLDVVGDQERLAGVIRTLLDAGILVSLFVDPDRSQVDAARETGATMVELHTGRYCEASGEASLARELSRLADAARHGAHRGLAVAAGHGLNLHNVRPVVAIPQIEELNIGHAIIAQAVIVGMSQAVKDMCLLMER